MAASWRDELARLLPMAGCAVLLGVATEMIVAVRPVAPGDVPFPDVDFSALAAVEKRDHDVYEEHRVKGTPFSDEMRAVGSAFSCWNGAAAGLALSLKECPGFPNQPSLRQGIQIALGNAQKHLGFDATMAQLDDLRAELAESFVRDLDAARAKPELLKSEDLLREAGSLLDILRRERWLTDDGITHVPAPILRARYRIFFNTVVFDLLENEGCDRNDVLVCYGIETHQGQRLLPPPNEELRAFLDWLMVHPVVREEDVRASGDAAADRRRLVYLDRLVELDAWARANGAKEAHPFLGDFNANVARGVLLFRIGAYPDAAQALCEESRKNEKNAPLKNWCLAAKDALQSGSDDD